MICIDFVAGSHGNFLEYVCNTHIFRIKSDQLPFNQLGASHLKSNNYNNKRKFYANHFSELDLPLSNKVVRITFGHDDLLLLTSGTFFRAGDAGIDVNQLDVDTYHKLKNSIFFVDIINEINSAYPDERISEHNPNCPRHVLREFFKFGFKIPGSNGFMKKLQQLIYPNDHNVIDFPYKNFYNKDLFLSGINNIANWLDKTIDINEVNTIWEIFYQKQIFRNYKIQCDSIISAVINRENITIDPLTLLQESYINGILEKKFNKEMPFYQTTYFKTTDEIINHLCLK